MACRVEPKAMVVEICAVSGLSMVQKLTAHEPIQMPNAARQPNNTVAASAIPEGGQITVTLPGGTAIIKPSFAVAIYSPAKTKASSNGFIK